VTDVARGAGAGVLLVEDHLLVQRQAAPAVLLRPADAGPAVRRQVPFPGEPLVEERVFVAGTAAAADDGEVTAEAVLEELPDLGPERFVLAAEAQVHRRSRLATT
jgi:hypothetical protein